MIAAFVVLALSAPCDEIVVDGEKRTYEVFTPERRDPSSKDAAPRPLLIVLHGHGGSAHQVRVDSGFDAEASKRGVVVLYPEGIDHHWRDARLYTQKTPDPNARELIARDEKFIFTVVDDLVAKGVVDKARVYVAGHSNGAMMTLTIACDHADRIAGIGVVAGNLSTSTCAPSRAVPAIFFQGTADPLVPFKGGPIGIAGARGFVRSADDTVNVFAQKAACTSAKKRAPVDNVKLDGTSIVVEDRAGCTVPIARVIVDGGGHGWPGHAPIFLRHSREIDATAAMAAFFFDGRSP